jgi:dUTPase
MDTDMIPRLPMMYVHPDADMKLPAYKGDAGRDIKAVSSHYDDYGNKVFMLGIKSAIPPGWAIYLFPRGSQGKKSMCLSNCVGVIDAGFRGEWFASFKPTWSYKSDVVLVDDNDINWIKYKVRDYEVGDYVVQAIMMPVYEIKEQIVKSLPDSERGEKSLDSSKK